MNEAQRMRIKSLAVALLKTLDANLQEGDGWEPAELATCANLFTEAALTWEPGETPEAVIERVWIRG